MELGLKDTQSFKISRWECAGCHGGLTVAIGDGRVLDGDVRATVDVPAVSVLLEVAVVACREQIQARVHHIARVGDDVVPERRIAHLDIAHAAPFQPDDGEQDRPLEFLVVDVFVPPCLTVPFYSPGAVDVDVAATEDEERSCILVLEVEGVGLPVCEVIGGEGQGALDVEID